MNVSGLSSASSPYWPGRVDSVSGASSYSPSESNAVDPAVSQMRGQIKQNSQDFRALKQALNGGDLQAASDAFATVQKDIQNLSQANGGKTPFDPNSPIGKDFQAIGDALNSGDIDAAKKAFSQMRQDMRAAHHGHGHHHHDDSSAVDSSQSTAGSVTSSLNVTA